MALSDDTVVHPFVAPAAQTRLDMDPSPRMAPADTVASPPQVASTVRMARLSIWFQINDPHPGQ